MRFLKVILCLFVLTGCSAVNTRELNGFEIKEFNGKEYAVFNHEYRGTYQTGRHHSELIEGIFSYDEYIGFIQTMGHQRYFDKDKNYAIFAFSTDRMETYSSKLAGIKIEDNTIRIYIQENYKECKLDVDWTKLNESCGLNHPGAYFVIPVNKSITTLEVEAAYTNAQIEQLLKLKPTINIQLKPVIYLYPEEETNVEIKMDLNGEFIYTYPKYTDCWNVTAYPDGRLIDQKTGFEYSYLFWESKTNIRWDFSEGFVVKGEDSTEFLRNTLIKMGLTPKEYNEFIVYWAPIMENNEYTLVSFQKELYEDSAKLTVNPTPDSVLRIFMAIKSLDEPIEIEPQVFETFERKGFTLVEWGGTIIE